jgi:predicted component of type VI protein secretion system
MPESKFQLVMNSGPTPGKEFPLEKNEVFIGRDLTNDVVINDAEVSRRHARLVSQAGGYILEDLGSTNGTFVNGQRLMGPYILRSAETVTLGEHVSLMFQEEKIDPDATVVSSSLNPPTSIPQPPPQVQPMPPLQPVQQFPPAAEPVMPHIEPQAPVYNQAPVTPPPPPPSFAGQVPQGPAIAVEPPKPAKKRGAGFWIVMVLLILLLLVCACGAFIYYIDSTAQWCKFLPFIPGCTGG